MEFNFLQIILPGDIAPSHFPFFQAQEMEKLRGSSLLEWTVPIDALQFTEDGRGKPLSQGEAVPHHPAAPADHGDVLAAKQVKGFQGAEQFKPVELVITQDVVEKGAGEKPETAGNRVGGGAAQATAGSGLDHVALAPQGVDVIAESLALQHCV
jgi:hypothetical protein